MKKSAIFFGSETGTTEELAHKIASKLKIKAFDIADSEPKQLESFEFLILGTSTWDDGNLQDDWQDFLEDYPTLNLRDKKVALFGLGDQRGHGNHFIDGVYELYKWAKKSGAQIVGEYYDDDYFFENSKSFINGKFIGLALDEDYQKELSQERIDRWVRTINSFIL